MTRHGSLAYYLAAWICGCFFLVLAVWAHATATGHGPFEGWNGARSLLAVYFFGLIFGFVDSIAAAFLLRRVAIAARFRRVWQWALAGAALAPLEVFALARWGDAMNWKPGDVPSVWVFFVLAPMIVEREAVWLAAPAGALAAMVLYSIHKAFGPKPSDANNSSAATTPAAESSSVDSTSGER